MAKWDAGARASPPLRTPGRQGDRRRGACAQDSPVGPVARGLWRRAPQHRRAPSRAARLSLGLAGLFPFAPQGLGFRVQVWGDHIERSIETGPGEILRHIGEDTLKRSRPAARTRGMRRALLLVECVTPVVSVDRQERVLDVPQSLPREQAAAVVRAPPRLQARKQTNKQTNALHCFAAALVVKRCRLRCLLALGTALTHSRLGPFLLRLAPT